MSSGPPPEPVGDDDLVGVLSPVRRVAEAMLGTGDAADDVVQQTAVHLLAHRERLDRRRLRRYAEITARNEAINELRHRQREAAHEPAALVETPAEPAEPHEQAVRRLEHRAAAAALADLSVEERTLLLASILDDRGGATQLSATGSPKARSLRLLRARARFRVFMVLRLRRIQLPTARCLPVLIALSGRDRRRQRALRAAEHVTACPVCRQLAPVLTSRERGLLGLLPWAAGAGGAGAAVGGRSTPRPAVTRGLAAATVATLIAGVAAAVLYQPASSPSAANAAAAPSAPSASRPVLAPVVLGTVLFTSGSSALDDAARAVIQAAATTARRQRVTALVVVGYTDARSDPASNQALSRQRADAVAAQLRSLLGTAATVTVEARGEAQPAAPNTTAGGRSLNRRAEIRRLG